MGRIRAYVGLGSNVGDRVATLTAAVHALAALPHSRLVAVSRLYATAPVGVTDQPEFLNAAVSLDVPAGPDSSTGALALLVGLKQIERAFGRRGRGRWGPREIDLDLLLFGRQVIDVERPPEGLSLDAESAGHALVVPHSEAHDRLFALAPLADLAPGLVPPGWGETVGTALRRRREIEGPEAARPVARWDRTAGRWAAGSGAEEAGG